MYVVGIDLGTTYTAAAVWRDGRAEIVSLGSRAAAIPSVVLLRDDETVLTGEPANRRGMTEPHRVSREFKRRLGDTTPILLGGSPYSAEALMARLLRWTLDEVATREGGTPTHLCVSHPANWGPYKRELLEQAVRLANVDQPVTFITEPEAAAIFYAHQQRVEPGSIVAVYDLGGGTFDAAVLQKTATGFTILGQPEGIERLGGIDFDAAIFHHVNQALDGKLEELDEDDAATLAAVARLREECVAAKETLSSDTDATIPVLLPNITTEVRITRAEFEAMIRPILHNSIDAMRRALRSAGVEAEQLHSVLLVGGSSRIPLVAQLVGAELGRPVAVDAHPKHAIPLGAAYHAAIAAGAAATEPAAAAGPAGGPSATGPVRAAGPVPGPTAPVGGPAAPTPPPAPPAAGAAGIAGVAGVAGVAAGVAASSPAGAAQPTAGGRITSSAAVPPAAGDQSLTTMLPPTPPAPPAPPVAGDGDGGKRRRAVIIGAATALVAVLAIGGAVYALSGDNEPPIDPGIAAGTGSPGPSGTPGATPTPGDDDPGNEGPGNGGATGGGGQQPPPPPPPPPSPDEDCAPAREEPVWVCLLDVYLTDSELVIEYEAEFAGHPVNINGGHHLHLYGGDGTTPPAAIMGTHADHQGTWQIEDRPSPLRYSLDHRMVTVVIGNHPKVCARIAEPSHALWPTADGQYTTGNCLPIRRP